MSMEEPTTVGEGESGAMPGSRSVAIAGTTYETAQVQGLQLRINSVPALRPQSDTSVEPGAQSLARDGLWRLSQSSWHRGAGQGWVDQSDSDPFRFNDSRGIDVFTKGELSLLRTSELDDTLSAGSYDFSDPRGDGIYLVDDGSTVLVTSSGGVTYGSHSGGWSYYAMSSPFAIQGAGCVDASGTFHTMGAEGGDRVIVSVALDPDSTTKKWSETPSGSIYDYDPPAISLGSIHWMSYHFDRIIGCANDYLVEWREGLDARLIATGPSESAGDNRFWLSSAASETHIYIGAIDGKVYKATVDPSTNETGAPSVAAVIPDTSSVMPLIYHLGLLFIGTGDGFRVGTPDGDGNLALSESIQLERNITHWTTLGEFVYGGTSGGGYWKINAAEFNGSAPAYSHFMENADPSGPCLTALDGTFYFTSDTDELHISDFASEYVASGWLTTGRYELGAAGDTKRLHQAGVAVRGGYGDLDIDTYGDDAIAANHADWPQSVTDSPERLTGYVTATSGAHVETRLTLTKGGTAPKTPTVSAFWSDTSIEPDRVLQASIPIDLKTAGRSVEDTYNELEDFMEQGTPIVLQIDSLKWTGWVSDINLLPGLNVLIVEMRIPL